VDSQHQNTCRDRLIAGYSAKNTGSSQLKPNASIEGIITGAVLTITNSDPGILLTTENILIGQLVALRL
jgi:hypothetical protein